VNRRFPPTFLFTVISPNFVAIFVAAFLTENDGSLPPRFVSEHAPLDATVYW